MTTNGVAAIEEQYRIVDLRSDTFTVPIPEMYKAIQEAKLGDDCSNEDPTVKELERMSAELLGKEAAVFTPTGTMSNLLAIMAHCDERSSEVIVGEKSHAFNSEQGGAAGVAGVQLYPIENNDDGTFCLKKVKLAIRPDSVHLPKTKLVMIEQTHAVCGARVLPLDWIEDLSKICKENNLKLHMDGARIFNAAIYLGVSAARVARDADSVCFCLSKGLSCPIGSVLVGSKEFIARAHRYRKVVGAAMRQVGILAAPGIVALKQVVPRLEFDHIRARKIAKALAELDSKNFLVEFEKVETNFFLIKFKTEKVTISDLVNRLQKVTDKELANGIVDNDGKGIIVKVGPLGRVNVRICCHLQVNDEHVDLAIKKLAYVFNEFDKNY